jgi:hypothetical protein
MNSMSGWEPIEDDEILYRRILTDWYDPTDASISDNAFKPNKHDVDGISLCRAKLVRIEVAAQGRSSKGYYVGCLKASDLRENGIEIRPDPQENNKGHCLIPSMTYEKRRTDEAVQQAHLLARKLTREVKGPFTMQETD